MSCEPRDFLCILAHTGPGEFQAITGLFRTPGESLTAYDQTQGRATLFPLASGEPRVVRSEAVPGGRGNFDAFGAFGDGRLLLYNPGGGFRPDLEPGLQWVTSEVVVFDPADGAGRIIAQRLAGGRRGAVRAGASVASPVARKNIRWVRAIEEC